jgi:hypothetical protein
MLRSNCNQISISSLYFCLQSAGASLSSTADPRSSADALFAQLTGFRMQLKTSETDYPSWPSVRLTP